MTGRDALEYRDLLLKFPPRPIRREADYGATMHRIDTLLSLPRMTRAEEDYLDLLSGLVASWEASHTEIPRVDGIQAIRFLMEQHELRQRDLVPIFGSEAVTSEILAGRRRLQAKHIQALAARFLVSPEVFFPLPEEKVSRRPGAGRRLQGAVPSLVDPARRVTATPARTTSPRASGRSDATTTTARKAPSRGTDGAGTSRPVRPRSSAKSTVKAARTRTTKLGKEQEPA